MFERETVSNYGEDQEEQFEIVQVSAEDTIDNDSISVAGWKEKLLFLLEQTVS